MKKILTLIIFAVLFLGLKAENSERIKVAIVKVDTSSKMARYSETITQIIESRLSNTGEYEVLEREKIKYMVEELKIKSFENIEKDRISFLGAEKIITGKLARIDKNYILTVKIIDVETSKVERSYEVMEEEDIVGMAHSVADAIIKNKINKTKRNIIKVKYPRFTIQSGAAYTIGEYKSEKKNRSDSSISQNIEGQKYNIALNYTSNLKTEFNIGFNYGIFSDKDSEIDKKYKFNQKVVTVGIKRNLFRERTTEFKQYIFLSCGVGKVFTELDTVNLNGFGYYVGAGYRFLKYFNVEWHRFNSKETDDRYIDLKSSVDNISLNCVYSF